MGMQTWQETLVTQQVAGSLLATYTTAKSVLAPAAIYTLPQNWFQIGRVLRIRAIGALSNIVTTPGTLTIQVMFGGVIAFTTGAMQLSTTAHTTIPFWFEAVLTCRAIGNATNANVIGQGLMHSQCVAATAVADGTQTHSVLMAPNTAPAVGTGFDSTASQAIDFWAGFSISNGGNGIQIQQYSVISEN